MPDDSKDDGRNPSRHFRANDVTIMSLHRRRLALRRPTCRKDRLRHEKDSGLKIPWGHSNQSSPTPLCLRPDICTLDESDWLSVPPAIVADTCGSMSMSLNGASIEPAPESEFHLGDEASPRSLPVMT